MVAIIFEETSMVNLRTNAALSHSKVLAANEDSLNAYFDILEEALEENIINQPCRIFNVDEQFISKSTSIEDS